MLGFLRDGIRMYSQNDYILFIDIKSFDRHIPNTAFPIKQGNKAPINLRGRLWILVKFQKFEQTFFFSLLHLISFEILY